MDQTDWQVKILGERPVQVSSTGIEIKMHGHIKEANDSDAVLFCSGRGVRAKLADESYLKSFQLGENRQLIGAIDSGALLLGRLGFFKGKPATTYPTAETKTMLESFGATVLWQSLVESGNVATAAQYLSGKF